jgi:hypothetical protein
MKSDAALTERPKPVLESVHMVFEQPEDSCSESDAGPNQIEIFTQDAGDGKFLVIKTERWAMDSIEDFDELRALINNFYFTHCQ